MLVAKKMVKSHLFNWIFSINSGPPNLVTPKRPCKTQLNSPSGGQAKAKFVVLSTKLARWQFCTAHVSLVVASTGSRRHRSLQ